MFVITDYTKTRIILFLSPWQFYFMDNLQIIYKVWGLSLELGTLCLYNKKSATYPEQPLTLYQLFDNLRTIKTTTIY